MAFGDKVMVYDRLSGVPGFNSLLRERLLDVIRSYAKSRQYFSNTTYAIIEKLIQDRKIGVFFTPSLRTTKFFTSNNPLNVVGGYNFDKHNIEVSVKWSFGIDAATDMMRPQMLIACKKIFALILSEALLLYDYKTNGGLSSRETVQKWYFTYFRSVLGDSLHRFQMADKLAKKISVDYGPRMYGKIEKALIEGRSPAVIIKKTGANEDLDIEGIPSVVKGDKQLRDIFVDAIEDFAVVDRDEYNVDNYAFKDIKTFTDEFGQFGEFLYKNRDLNLMPERISEVPADPTVPFEKKMSSASRARQYELDREADKELDRTYEKYIQDNPELKKAIEQADTERKQAYFVKSEKRKDDIEQTKALEDSQRKMLTAFDSEPGETFVKKMYLDSLNNKDVSKPSLDEIADIPKGLVSVYQRKAELEKQIQLAISGGLPSQDPEQYKSLIELYGNVSQNATDIYNDSVTYFKALAAHCSDKTIKDKIDNAEKSNTSAITPADVISLAQTMSDAIVQSERADEKNLAIQTYAPETSLANSRTYGRLIGDIKNASERLDDLNQRINSASDAATKKFLQDERQQLIQQASENIKRSLDPQLVSFAYLSGDRNGSSKSSRESIIDDIRTLRGSSTSDVLKGKYNTYLNSNGVVPELVTRFEKNKQDDIESIFNNRNRNAQVDVANSMASSTQQNLRRPSMHNANDVFRNIGLAVKTSRDAVNNNARLSNVSNATKRAQNQTDLRDIKTSLDSHVYDGKSFENAFMSNGQPDISKFESAAKDYMTQHNIASLEDAKVRLLNHIINSGRGNGSSGYIADAYNKAHQVILSNAHDAANAANLTVHANNYNAVVQLTKSALSSKNTQFGDVVYDVDFYENLSKQLHGSLIRNPQTPEDMKHNLEIYKKLANIQHFNDPRLERTILYGYEKDREKGARDRLKDKIKAQERAYRRQLYLDGYDWAYSRMPKWNDVVRWFKQGVNMAEETARAVKGLYRLAKVVYPSKTNVELYANQPMGFEIVGHVGYFDLAYKINCGVKRMYELNKGTVRRDMVYDEIYMPVSILQKMLFAQINTMNEYSPEILNLIDCANKGLELMM